MMYAKIAIINPHTKENKGAYSKYLEFSEYDFFQPITYYITEILNNSGCLISTNYYIEAKRFIKLDKYDIYKDVIDYAPTLSIEPHFNSFDNPDFEGTTVLYEKVEDKDFGITLLDNISTCLNTKKLHIQRVVEGGRGYGNLYKFKFPAIITESFFGSSSADCSRINPFLISYAHVLGIVKYLSLIR